MNFLLIAATIKEIQPYLKHHRKAAPGPDMDVLVTGIGLVAATYSLLKQVTIKKPGLIIQAGIAGCFDKDISLGSVVVVRRDTIADLGVMENKQLRTMFDLGLARPGHAPYNKGWLVNPHNHLLNQTGLKSVPAISVNQVTTDKKIMRHYQNRFQPVIESMEGAALHYVCLMEKIPFLQVRSLSNYVGERNRKKWYMNEAIHHLNQEIFRLTNNL